MPRMLVLTEDVSFVSTEFLHVFAVHTIIHEFTTIYSQKKLCASTDRRELNLNCFNKNTFGDVINRILLRIYFYSHFCHSSIFSEDDWCECEAFVKT